MIKDGGEYSGGSDAAEPEAEPEWTAEDSLLVTLKDLSERILPQGLKDELRALVQSGAVDPLTVPKSQPLLSPVSQMFTTPEPAAWLKILFSKEPHKFAQAKCPCYDFSEGSFTVNPHYEGRYLGRSRYAAPNLETPSLAAVLSAVGPAPVTALASIDPGQLAAVVPDRQDNKKTLPLLHALLSSDEFSVETFDKLEAAAGGTGFLSIRNDRGETLFHRIATNPYWCEDQVKLDIASWMLQKNPALVNMPDRFGWTPLDRQLSLGGGKADHSMGRLLIASGARLEKQIAPAFNLRAELDARSGAALDKPAAPKAVLRTNSPSSGAA